MKNAGYKNAHLSSHKASKGEIPESNLDNLLPENVPTTPIPHMRGEGSYVQQMPTTSLLITYAAQRCFQFSQCLIAHLVCMATGQGLDSSVTIPTLQDFTYLPLTGTQRAWSFVDDTQIIFLSKKHRKKNNDTFLARKEMPEGNCFPNYCKL